MSDILFGKYSRSSSDPAVLIRVVQQAQYLDQIAKAIQLVPDINYADENGTTAIKAAINRQWWGAADLLVKYGAKPPPVIDAIGGTITDLQGETKLTNWIKNRQSFYPIWSMLNNGFKVNETNRRNQTPLAVAKERGWPFAANYLISKGGWVDPAAQDPDEIVGKRLGTTRLLSLIASGDGIYFDAIEELLEQGADPNKPDKTGLTPYALAKAMNWPAMVKLLAWYGATKDATLPDPNQPIDDEGTTLFQYAIHSYSGFSRSVLLALMDNGADLEAADPKGKSPIHWAAIYKQTNLFFEYLDRGVCPSITDTENQLTTLAYAAMNNAYEIAEYNLSADPKHAPNERTGPDNATALHRAAYRKGAYKLVQLLIDLGADVNARNSRGETPLHMAIHKYDIPMMKLLIKNGADVAKGLDIPGKNSPLFHLTNCATVERLAVIKFLINKGANYTVTGQEEMNSVTKGQSLLDYAVRYRNIPVVKLLLELGVDPNEPRRGHVSDHGESLLHHCLSLRQDKTMELLLEYGADPLKVFQLGGEWLASGEMNEGKEDKSCSAYEYAKHLVSYFGDDAEYTPMLEMLEKHIAESKKQKAAAPKTGSRNLG